MPIILKVCRAWVARLGAVWVAQKTSLDVLGKKFPKVKEKKKEVTEIKIVLLITRSILKLQRSIIACFEEESV